MQIEQMFDLVVRMVPNPSPGSEGAHVVVRRFDEPIEVRLEGEPSASPAAFLWRGRIYAVRAVDGHWQERRAWWRGASGSAAAGDRRVWRVRAQAGRTGTPGIYELGCDGTDTTNGAWVLLRAHD